MTSATGAMMRRRHPHDAGDWGDDQAAPKESEEFLNRQVRRHISDQPPSCTPRAQPPCCLNYPNRLNADRWLVLQRAKEAEVQRARLLTKFSVVFLQNLDHPPQDRPNKMSVWDTTDSSTI